jgi:DNA mismatch endonuclease (patch repair protein)
VDHLDAASRSRLMGRIRAKGTRPEAEVGRVLRSLRYRFETHSIALPGKPDVVLSRRKIAIFIHGCFWHMHTCRRGRSIPMTNAAFWREKRAKNRKRDRRAAAALRLAGWRVLVVWECQTRQSEKLKKRLKAFIRKS